MTNISDMDATQNVHADVATGNAVTWISYYTHHRDMNAPSMYTHMNSQATSFTERFIAHIAVIWTITSM